MSTAWDPSKGREKGWNKRGEERTRRQEEGSWFKPKMRRTSLFGHDSFMIVVFFLAAT